jgi:hypothetical protein
VATVPLLEEQSGDVQAGAHRGEAAEHEDVAERQFRDDVKLISAAPSRRSFDDSHDDP